jgi:hypothetical protein
MGFGADAGGHHGGGVAQHPFGGKRCLTRECAKLEPGLASRSLWRHHSPKSPRLKPCVAPSTYGGATRMQRRVCANAEYHRGFSRFSLMLRRLCYIN